MPDMDFGLVVGPQGPQGEPGAQGERGPQGVPGPQGVQGEGVPMGGTAGQVLVKATDTDFDTKWENIVPTGGTAGQVLTKVSDVDFDAGWEDTVPASNPNLLDNWYFADPVNQRGQTEYAGAVYSIDRWYVGGDPGTSHKILLNSSGLVLETTSAIHQKLETKLKDGTVVTYSALIDNDIYTTTFTINNSSGYERRFEKNGFVLANNGVVNYFQIYNQNETNHKNVIAAKLEIGPRQTLARKEGDMWVLNDPPPNKTLELLKCQKCQLSMGQYIRLRASEYSANYIDFWIPLPVSMRGIPRIVNPDKLRVAAINRTEQAGFTFEVIQTKEIGVMLRATKANHGLTDGQLTTIGQVILDANP